MQNSHPVFLFKLLVLNSFIGPEMLLRQASSLGNSERSEIFFDADGGDVVELHQWKCVRTVNGICFLLHSEFPAKVLSC